MIEEIRDRHKFLESIKMTQSHKLITERASSSHKDRGVLLRKYDELLELMKARENTKTAEYVAEIAKLVQKVKDLEKEVEEQKATVEALLCENVEQNIGISER